MMTKQKAQDFKRAWFDAIATQNDIPLFFTEANGVTPMLSEEGLLQRSVAFTEALTTLRNSVIAAYSQKKPQPPEGICYLVYRRIEEGVVDPLYVGMAECVGKKGTISALFKRHGWMRFDHKLGSKGHIGNLNEAINHSKHSYSHWIEAMFEEGYKAANLALKAPVYVHIDIWNSESQSVIKELGHTPLFVEEKLRLWILAASGYENQLLNRDGNRVFRTQLDA